MSKIFFACLIIALTISIAAQDSDDYKAGHVIVIGVDGMSPDGIRTADTPVMDYMMENGSHTFHARAVLPTSSSSNWASMLMGASPAQHGITSNGWERDDYVLPPAVMGVEEIFPTIFGVIRNQKPDAVTASIYDWDGFGRLYEKSTVSYDYDGKGEYDTALKAAAYIEKTKPLFTFIHLDHVDHAGHKYGHGSDHYYHSVEVADSLIGIIYDGVKAAGIEDETLILITADHGGVGYGHGGETLAEIEIPFILFGKGVKQNHIISHPVYTFDNAATAAYALNVKPPYAWIGRPVKSAFAGNPDPDDSINKVRSLLAPPTILPQKYYLGSPGGLFIDEEPYVEIKANDKGELRYTTDGSEPTKDSELYTDKFKLSQSSVVKAKLFNGNEVSPVTQGYFRLISSDSDNGVAYKYYETDVRWKSLPDFDKLNAVRSGKVYEIDLMSLEHRDEDFGLVFKGYVDIEKEGEYRFYTKSDDGSKLYINGKEVVDNDGDHGAEEKSGSINLTPGKHRIKVTHYNAGGGYWLNVFYKGPGIAKQVLSAEKLFTTK